MRFLRNAGLEVLTGNEVWGTQEFARLPDVDWITWAASNGYVGLTADEKIRYRRPERDALIAAGLQLFCFPHNNLAVAEQARRVLDHSDVMEQWCRARPGPWLAGLYADGLRLKQDWAATGG